MNERQRRQVGLPRLNSIAKAIKPIPSNGGSTGYDITHRQEQIHSSNMGIPTMASDRSIRRWRNERLHPFKSTGNKNQVALSGIYQTLLIVYRQSYPKATADEIIVFIANHANPVRIFSRQNICDAERRLGMTTKVGSTTAYQALLPNNILRRELFWTMPPPIGIITVPFEEFIDLDEAAINVQICNRRYGKSYSGLRVRQSGNYTRVGEKFTLILAVGTDGFKHIRMRKECGTTKLIFIDYIRGLLARLGNMVPFRRRTFLWDNLQSHYSDEVYYMIYNAGHRIVPRPAYYPIDGPIEYIFNLIEMELRQSCYLVRTDIELVNNTNRIIANISTATISNTFNHCGY